MGTTTVGSVGTTQDKCLATLECFNGAVYTSQETAKTVERQYTPLITKRTSENTSYQVRWILSIP